MIKNFLSLLKQTFGAWQEDKVPQLAAALSYYTLFSIAPLLIILIIAIGFFYGPQATQGQLVFQMQELIGKDAAIFIQNVVVQSYRPGNSFLSASIGIITLLLGAIGIIQQVQNSLNTIWRVPDKSHAGIINQIKSYFISLFIIVISVGVLLFSFIVTALLAAVGKTFGNSLPLPLSFLELSNNIVTFFVITFLLAFIFKFLPNIKIAWKDVWMGSFTTSLLFTIGKFAIGFYLGKGNVLSAYGSAGAVIAILLWIYYSSIIFFSGAEFTKIFAYRRGSRKNQKEKKSI